MDLNDLFDSGTLTVHAEEVELLEFSYRRSANDPRGACTVIFRDNNTRQIHTLRFHGVVMGAFPGFDANNSWEFVHNRVRGWDNKAEITCSIVTIDGYRNDFFSAATFEVK